MKRRRKTKRARTADSELQCELAPGTRFKLIGLGGIGSVVVLYLALFLHSRKLPFRLVLVDGDKFELANLQRVGFRELGNKAEVKVLEMDELLGDSEVALVPVPEHVGEGNVEKIIQDGDYVFSCVDNHPTRKLISDRCQQLDNVALFSGGNDGVDPPKERGTYGSVQVAIRTDGVQRTVPITEFHPEIASPVGTVPTMENCLQAVPSTPQILFANLAVGSAMLNAFFAYTCGRLTYQEVKLDVVDARMLPQFPLQEAPEPI
jgi:hypothetical protein